MPRWTRLSPTQSISPATSAARQARHRWETPSRQRFERETGGGHMKIGTAVLGVSLGVLAGMTFNGVLAQDATKRDFNKEIEVELRAAKNAAQFDHQGTLTRICVLPQSEGVNTSDNPFPYVSDPSKV